MSSSCNGFLWIVINFIEVEIVWRTYLGPNEIFSVLTSRLRQGDRYHFEDLRALIPQSAKLHILASLGVVEAVEIPTVIRWTPSSQGSRHAPWRDRWVCKSYGFMTPGPHQLTATDDDAAGAVSSACARAHAATVRTHLCCRCFLSLRKVMCSQYSEPMLGCWRKITVNKFNYQYYVVAEVLKIKYHFWGRVRNIQIQPKKINWEVL